MQLKWIPPTNSDYLVFEDKKFTEINDAIKLIDTYTQSVEALFVNEIPTYWNFGAPIVWAHKYKQVKVAPKIFFPDVGIFSNKIRLFDVFRQRYFATYSDFHHSVVLNKLKNYFLIFTVRLLKLEHPYACAQSIIDDSKQSFADSALFFLPKSTPVTDRPWNIDDLKNGIEICLLHAKKVSLCVYYQDIPKALQLSIDCKKVDIVSAGSRYDALFYFRLKFLIERHKFIAYFEPGSHSIFGSFSNKKHLFLNRQQEVVYKTKYQASRYPTNADLFFFKQVCVHSLQENNLIEAEQFKQFLNYSINCEENDKLTINNFAPRYFVYKLAKKIIFYIDKLKKTHDIN